MSSALLQRLLNSHKALGQLAERGRGHDSQSQSDPLLSLASFVAIQKNLLFMNYQWIGSQLQKTGKDTGEKAERRRGGGAQEGRVEEVNEYTRPLFSLLLKWRGGRKPAAKGKGGWGKRMERQ